MNEKPEYLQLVDPAVKERDQGKRRRPGRPKGIPTGLPSAPAALSKRAKSEWVRICSKLKEIPGLVTNLDRAALARYCEAWADWLEAKEKIREEGAVQIIQRCAVRAQKGQGRTEEISEVPTVNPWVKIASERETALRQASADLGLTPMARSRLKIDLGKSQAKKSISDRLKERIEKERKRK